MSKYTLNRRTMLRGMAGGSAITLGLPLLEAMLNTHGDALANGDALPLRFISYYWADGVVLGDWEPPDTGPGYTLPAAMQSFAGNIRDYVSVISGRRNNQADGFVLTHHEGMCAFSGHPITSAPGPLSSDATGETLDQRIADVPGVADRTPVRAMHVQMSKRQSTDGDGGTTVIAMSHRDVGGNLIAQVPETDPAEVWQNVFGSFVGDIDDKDLRQSVLDFVKDDASALRNRLGMADQARIDAHLQGISELENKINAIVPLCMVPAQPTETNQDSGGVEPISAVVDAMSDLIAYAFTCDITRVATVLFKKFVSSTVFDEINANDQHHSSSHMGSSNPNYRAGVTYQMEKFADLLNKLYSFEDPTGGNLLDSTVIFASSDCSTGSSHTLERQPMMVAGGGRGYLATPGIHHQSTPWNGNNGSPNSSGNTSDVLLTCLQAFDPAATSVGSGATGSSSPLTELLA